MLDSALVYKILSLPHWQSLLVDGVFAGSADDLRDGFIHLSTAEQVAGSVQRYFAAHTELALVGLSAYALGADLRFEISRNQQAFPHLYTTMKLANCRRIYLRENSINGEWHWVESDARAMPFEN